MPSLTSHWSSFCAICYHIQLCSVGWLHSNVNNKFKMPSLLTQGGWILSYCATCSPTGKCTRYRSRYSSCRSLRDLSRHRGMSLGAWWVHHNCTNQSRDTSLVCLLRLANYVQLSHKNSSRRHQHINKCVRQSGMQGEGTEGVCTVVNFTDIRLFDSLWNICLQLLQKCYVSHTHLTHDEHVLAFNDALLHFGLDRLPQLHLIVITVRRVQVTVTSSYSCLSCTLTQFWACVLMIM